MSGAIVHIDVQSLDEAELTVRDVAPSLVSANIKGDGVNVILLDEAVHVRRVLTRLLTLLDASEAKS